MKDVSGQVAIIGPKGESLPAKNGASVPVEAPLGDSIYKLMDGKTLLASVTVSVTCGAPLEAKDGKCTKPVVKPLHYDVIVAVMRDIKPRNLVARVKGDSCATATFEPAVNKTSYPENPEWNFSLFNGEIADKLADGYIPVRLQVVVDESKGHVFLYNPITNAVTDDDGTHGALPPAYPNTNPPWRDVLFEDPDPYPLLGAYVQTDKLFVYVTYDNDRVVFCDDMVAGKRSDNPKKIFDFGDSGGAIGFYRYTN